MLRRAQTRNAKICYAHAMLPPRRHHDVAALYENYAHERPALLLPPTSTNITHHAVTTCSGYTRRHVYFTVTAVRAAHTLRHVACLLFAVKHAALLPARTHKSSTPRSCSNVYNVTAACCRPAVESMPRRLRSRHGMKRATRCFTVAVVGYHNHPLEPGVRESQGGVRGGTGGRTVNWESHQ